jgi:hypothetical protein
MTAISPIADPSIAAPVARSRNRYGQVLLTYASSRAEQWTVLGLAAYAGSVFSLRRGALPEFVKLIVLLIGLILSQVAVMVVTAHLKEQLADARARLTPRFRLPHLIVAAALLVSLTVGVASLTVAATMRFVSAEDSTRFYVSPLGIIALTTYVGATSAWLVNLQSLAYLVFYFGQLLLVSQWRTLERVIAMICGPDHAALKWAVLGAGAAGLAALLARLGVMHEEMHEANRLGAGGYRLRAAMTGDRRARGEASGPGTGALDDFLRGSRALDDAARNVAGANFLARAWHWRRGLGTGYVYVGVGAMLAGWSFLAPHLERRHMSDAADRALVAPFIFGLLLPIVVAAQAWPKRWLVLGTESLRPASRRQFLLEQGAALAIDLFIAWGCVIAGTVLPSVVMNPAAAGQPQMWLMIAVLGCELVPLFAINVWVLRLRSARISTATVIASGLVQVGTLTWIGNAERHLAAVAAIACPALLACGAGIAWHAYRRWLATDLD